MGEVTGFRWYMPWTALLDGQPIGRFATRREAQRAVERAAKLLGPRTPR